MHTELEGEHEHLLQFLYSCPIGLAEITADGTIGMMNPFAMKLLLPIARTPQTDNLFAILDPYAPELRNMLDGFASPWGAVCENHRIVVSPHTKEGDREANVLSCTLVKLKTWHYIVTLADVSAQVAQERRLQQAETWFASLLDSVENFAIVSLDAQGKISAVNRSVARQTGLNESQTVGQTLEIFDLPGPSSTAITADEQIALARRDGWHLTECWQVGLGGKPYWCQRLIAVRSDDGGTSETSESSVSGYTVVLREVLNRNADFGKLTLMLTQDFLTGASNRAHFFDIAERECARSRRYGQPLALIGLDLDHFKRVNDSHGHGAGDAVLKSISRECKALLRQSDTFARLGGEEFCILLPSTDLQHAAQLAERLRAIIAATAIDVGGTSLHVTASFGCATTNSTESTATALVAAADKALYAAKRSGRNRVVSADQTLDDEALALIRRAQPLPPA
jgi:diguanylate cyclase (GGDEF)-like protein/PAS domain S-box-containing protein